MTTGQVIVLACMTAAISPFTVWGFIDLVVRWLAWREKRADIAAVAPDPIELAENVAEEIDLLLWDLEVTP